MSISENWRELVKKYQEPSNIRALWQVLNSIGSSLALWVLMYFLRDQSPWISFLIAILNGAIVIRIFIIFHDCGHGSFMSSHKANTVIGLIAGAFTITPYHHWKWEHSVHHASSGNLDRRGTGDIWTLTVREYLEASKWKRFSYRLVRNPFVLFLIAPLFLFLVLERKPSKKASAKIKRSVYITNVVYFFLFYFGMKIFGVERFLLIKMTTLTVATSVGVWLFYVQHQFEGTYWASGKDWDYATAALKGSSYYKLPRVLQWFSGNIGFHHIHHLSSAIPNYNLEKCHKANPLFQNVTALTLFSSFKSITFRLWDEQQKKLVGYKRLREIKKLNNLRCTPS